MLGRQVGFDETAAALVVGFSRRLNQQLVPEDLTEFEISLAQQLAKEKYSSSEWLNRK